LRQALHAQLQDLSLISLFRKKVPDVSAASLGQLRYFLDRKDEHWELVDNPIDTRNGIELDFGAVSGSSDGPNQSSITAFVEHLKKPNILWNCISAEFIQMVQNDLKGLTMESVHDYLYIRSLSVESDKNFEVGFHAHEKDIFMEIFVQNGVVTKVERDDGCCAV
jgi:hypothetical protein